MLFSGFTRRGSLTGLPRRFAFTHAMRDPSWCRWCSGMGPGQDSSAVQYAGTQVPLHDMPHVSWHDSRQLHTPE